MCKIPQEPLTVICVQVEQILKLIRLHPYAENVKRNFAIGSGRIVNQWLTISKALCPEFKTRACAAGAESITANWVLRKQGQSDWQKQSNSDRGEPSQPYWRHTPFFWSFCQETDSRCHFERLVQSARHWHWNEKEIPNKQLTWRYTYTTWGLQQHIQCLPQTVFLRHYNDKYRLSGGRHLHYCTNTYGETETNYLKMSCHIMSLVSLTIASGILREQKRRTMHSSAGTLKQQVAPVAGGTSLIVTVTFNVFWGSIWHTAFHAIWHHLTNSHHTPSKQVHGVIHMQVLCNNICISEDKVHLMFALLELAH